MQGLKGITKDLIKLHGTYSAPKGFARQLGALLDKPKSTASLKSFLKMQEAIFSYKVPHTVCRPNDRKMPLSAIIAVFDELSTVGIIASDKNHRWGASTNLSAVCVGDLPEAGSDIELKVIYDKFGKTLSFCRMELRDSSGSLVAKGSHTKYMPVSWANDNILSIPIILGFIMKILFHISAESVSRTWLGQRLVWSEPEDGIECTNNLENIVSSFGLTYDESKNIYEFIPGQHHCNPMAFHGGAAAMAAEAAIMLHAENSMKGVNAKGGLKRLNLTYLSAMKKSKSQPIGIAIRPHDGLIEGALSQKGTDRVLFEGSFHSN